MMLIREFQPSDLATIRRIHAQSGLDYELPDISDPTVLTKLVVEGENGKVMMAAFLRLTAETYLLVDGKADDPAGRWCALQSLHEAARVDAHTKGLNDVQAFIPPDVAKRFAKRLTKLGWQKSQWQPWTRFTQFATWPSA